MTARSLLRLPPKESPVSVRFQPETLARLDRVAHALSRANVRVGRSSVVKFAIERALVTLEAELALAPAPTLSSKHA